MFRKIILCSLAALLLVVNSDPALAAKKKKKKKAPPKPPVVQYVNEDDTFKMEVAFKLGKKNLKRSIDCLDNVPGSIKSTAQGNAFTSYANTIKSLKKKLKKKPSAKLKSQVALYQKMQSSGKAACSKPPFFSLDQYKGNFGRAEAQILCNRFLFGCSPADVDRAVAEGLDAFVNRVTSYVAEPAVDAIEQDLRCDGRIAGEDENNDTCDPYDPNDLYTPGVRYGIYHRVLYGQNRFFERMWMFLHDDRSSVSSNALQGCERHALPTYVDMVRRAALSGSAKEYCGNLVKDHFAFIRYLNLDGSLKFAPNEDAAREVKELACSSPFNLDGTQVYGDFSVAQSALALTGWLIEGRQEYPPGGRTQGYNVCRAGYFEGRHADGPKTLFSDGARPFPITVYDYRDLPYEIFKHPHTAEAWARDLWQEYISPKPSITALENLAKLIREHDFNLIPVMRKIMKSKAMFDPESRNSLFKYPYELLMGLALQTGVPTNYTGDDRPYAFIDRLLGDVGQQPLLAPSVFGWYPEKLAGEFRVLDRRNAIIELFRSDLEDFEREGFNMADKFLQGLVGTANPGLSAAERVADALGIKLNDAQKAELDHFMNFTLDWCWNGRPGCAQGQEYLEVRDLFDPHPAAYPDNVEKLRDLIILLSEQAAYAVK